MKVLTAYLFLAVFLNFSFVLGQDQKAIERLNKTIKTTTDDSVRVDAMVQLDALIYTSDSDLDKKLNEEIITICLANSRKPHISQSLRKFFYKQYAHSLNNLSIIAIEKSEMYLALELLLKAYKIAKKQQIKVLESNVLNNIGMVYRSIGSNKKALWYYLKSVQISKDSVHDANTFNNIGLCYQDMGNLEKAFTFYEISLRLSRQSNNQLNEANTICNMADSYFSQKSFRQAKSFYEKAHEIYQNIQNNMGLAYSSNKLGACYEQLGEINHAISYYRYCYSISKKENIINVLKDNTRNLYLAYKKIRNNDSAFYFLEEHNHYFMAYNNEMANNKVIKKQFEIEFEQKKLVADLKYQKKIEISNEKNKKQQILIVIISFVLILIIVFYLLIKKSLKEVKIQKEVIENQKILVETKNKEIMDSITYAKRIQSAILPPNKLVKEYFKDSFIFYKPKDIVAGDFYWFEVINEQIFFAAADCTGHGVPGAMVSVVCHNALNRSVKEFNLKNPGEILDKTREIVIAEFEKADEDVKDGMDISLCALNLKTNTLYWAGANNPLWILRDQTIVEYKGDKQPIGKFSDASKFTTHHIELKSRDEIYIFTDGFQDQFGGEKNKKFKASRFRDLLISIASLSMDQKKAEIARSFEEWKGRTEQVDDVCLIGVKF